MFCFGSAVVGLSGVAAVLAGLIALLVLVLLVGLVILTGLAVILLVHQFYLLLWNARIVCPNERNIFIIYFLG